MVLQQLLTIQLITVTEISIHSAIALFSHPSVHSSVQLFLRLFNHLSPSIHSVCYYSTKHKKYSLKSKEKKKHFFFLFSFIENKWKKICLLSMLFLRFFFRKFVLFVQVAFFFFFSVFLLFIKLIDFNTLLTTMIKKKLKNNCL